MPNSDSAVQIIPFYAHPHVHTVIHDNTWYDETVAQIPDPNDLPFATCIVTGADTGIDNTFVKLSSEKVKDALFGKSNYARYGQPSLQANALFNGKKTNVWFCRVLPDNATYANIVILAKFRKGKILNELGQETGLSRLEVKFDTAYVNKPYVTMGARTDEDIYETARSMASLKADPNDGYMTLPLFYVRSIGRGKYGNDYSFSLARDPDAEKEYGLKMYSFNLLRNTPDTRVIQKYCGSLYQTTKYDMSTLISDVIDQFATGSSPISIIPFDDNFETLYNFYADIVEQNSRYLDVAGGTDEEIAALKTAQTIDLGSFDPFFGIVLNSRIDEEIPYYRNYTAVGEPWVDPELTIPVAPSGSTPSDKPMNISDWNTAAVGSRVLVCADALHDGNRWMYSVVAIDTDTGAITYDEGSEVAIDADQYDGKNIGLDVGNMLVGGHDGDFEEITVDGETRAPNSAEMKLLLAREQVKAFRGIKDRKILSPARVNLDFIIDANYNMTTDDTLVTSGTTGLYGGSTVLTDADHQTLAVIGGTGLQMDYSDLNVKQAIYDLNEFRNKNGMTVNPERGAGCSIYLDCGLVGLKSLTVNYELMNIINMMEGFDGRATSIDLGYYEIFDPISTKRVKVTVTYYIAKNLVPHMMQYGINKPFTYKYATLRALQRDRTLVTTGDMIRDSFRPDIDLIDWDVKEALYKSRINYYLTSNEGRVVERACQNTRQREASALLEENNVRVLNTLKKGLEAACRGYLYEWNDPAVRKGYTTAQMDVYRNWIGTYVEDLDIQFTANEWEQERMIMHCYVVVKFRDIVKRIILEINVERPNYNNATT